MRRRWLDWRIPAVLGGALIIIAIAVVLASTHHGARGKPGPPGKPGRTVTATPQPQQTGRRTVTPEAAAPVVADSPEPHPSPSPAPLRSRRPHPKPTVKPTPRPSPSHSTCVLIVCIRGGL